MDVKLTKEYLATLIDSGLSGIQIAKQLNLKYTYVLSRMTRWGLKSKFRFKNRQNPGAKKIHIDKERFVRLVEQGLSNKEIAEILNIKLSLVQRRMYSWQIKTKHKKRYSLEEKLKLSILRKEFLKNNPEKHGWRKSSKFKSVPCEKLKEFLISKNIKFEEEHQPLLEDNRFYSIDISFPELKIGIEVNGNQHYNRDGTLKEYYQIRHDLIEAKGWILHELHYSICFNLQKIETLINSIFATIKH